MTIQEKINNCLYHFYKFLPEKFYPFFLKKIYKDRTGHTLNLKDPKRISEKIQWLKLYDNIPIKTMLADKLTVREWVKSKTDNLNFPQIYGIWDSFENIDFEILPDAFYLKTNHGATMNIQIMDKKRFLQEGKQKVAKLFNKWLNTNFAFLWGFELQYKNIIPKVYAEERLFIGEHKRVSDYKIWCINGKAKFIEYYIYPQKSKPEDAKLAIYDTNWNKMPFTHSRPMYESELTKPEKLDEMLAAAEILAKDFKLVRVDLIDIENKIYFAEMTFTPCSGHMIVTPDEYDFILGDMLNLE